MRRAKVILMTVFLILVLFNSISSTRADTDPPVQGEGPNPTQIPPQGPPTTGPGSFFHMWVCERYGLCFCVIG